MSRFRMDNTEGYTQTQLDELNRRYEIGSGDGIAHLDPSDPLDKAVLDNWAEIVQGTFDTVDAGVFRGEE